MAGLALLGASPASAAVTRVTIDVPTSGDASYGVVQVKLAKQSGKSRKGRDRVFASKIGGLSFDVRSGSWRKLRASTKVHVAVSKIKGEGASYRNVALFVTRKKVKGGPKTARITFTIRNATAVKSFWVKKVDKRGNATIFKVRNIISTAVGNWTRYVATLGLARAFRAAAKPVDKKGRFTAKSRAAQQEQGTIYRGGSKMTVAATRLFNLLFGTITDTTAYQAAKQSPVVTDYIRSDLNNPDLAKRWAAVAAKLPLAVPDTYAAAAKQEAQFSKIAKPRISKTKVVIADLDNSTRQAAIETPRPANITAPGRQIAVQLAGDGGGSVKDGFGQINCPPTCSHVYPSGSSPTFMQTPRADSDFVSWDGCTGGVSWDFRCQVTNWESKPNLPTRTAVATFALKPGQAPPPPQTPPSSPATPDSGFGTNGLTLTPISHHGSPVNAYAKAVAAQPTDGKLVIAGARTRAGDPATSDWVLARYTADGALDPSFRPAGSPPGTLVLIEDGGHNGASDVLVEPDGDVDVVGGHGGTDAPARIYQVDSAGAFTTFGNGSGVADIPIPDSTQTTTAAIARQPDGKLVVAGTATINGDLKPFVARFDASGAPDTSFAAPHAFSFVPDADCDSLGESCLAFTLELRTSGTSLAAIYVGGIAFNGFVGRVWKLVPTSGQSMVAGDGTWGSGGAVSLATSAVQSPYDLDLGPSGTLLVGGGAEAGLSSQCGIVRLTSAGSPDPAFGNAGVGRINRSNGCMVNSFAQQANGAIVFVGESYNNPYVPVLGRFTASGQPDDTFVAGGSTTAPGVGEPGFYNDMLLQGSKIVGVGGALDPHQIVLGRYVGG